MTACAGSITRTRQVIGNDSSQGPPPDLSCFAWFLFIVARSTGFPFCNNRGIHTPQSTSTDCLPPRSQNKGIQLGGATQPWHWPPHLSVAAEASGEGRLARVRLAQPPDQSPCFGSPPQIPGTSPRPGVGIQLIVLLHLRSSVLGPLPQDSPRDGVQPCNNVSVDYLAE